MLFKITHMISLSNIGYSLWTKNYNKAHQRKLEARNRSNLKIVPRDPIFEMKSHMISLTHICYAFLTPNLYRGLCWSLEVQKR